MINIGKPKISPESPPSAFDAIAPAWYNFRQHTIFKTELEALAERWQRGSLLNLGCGHGADFLPFKDTFELSGIDYSAGMLKQANKFAIKHGFHARLVNADMRKLPFADASIDYAISIAALHHLKGHNGQLQALTELRRVLKPGAEAFVTVWNRRQPRFWLKSKELLVPFNIKGETIERYYYLFTFGEIERLAGLGGFEVLKSSPESRYHSPVRAFSRNICLLLKKTN
jgi:ubiquinone/menaquinone biosynthesis C-methylase UbiE